MNYSVLIQTCDKYSDCWKPFFTCFDRFFPIEDCEVYIANEDCHIDRPDYVGQIRTGSGSWSDRARTAVEILPDKPILYMLEDFWITRTIDINGYFNLFKQYDMDSLRIASKVGRVTTFHHIRDNFYSIDEKGRYILSLQPCFWNKDFLLSNLIHGEDPWQFETTGTDRLRST